MCISLDMGLFEHRARTLRLNGYAAAFVPARALVQRGVGELSEPQMNC
ncbi:MAG: hypothetical protein M3O62_05790 [Pseudomonadota bacterium]|nr:hypothetical protein [Pseudomonadota bacterium]